LSFFRLLDLEQVAMTPELLLAPFTNKGKKVGSSFLEVILELKTKTAGAWICNQCKWNSSYGVWPPEGV